MKLDQFIRAIKEKRNLDVDVFVMNHDGKCYEPMFIDTSVDPRSGYAPSSVVIVPKSYENEEKLK